MGAIEIIVWIFVVAGLLKLVVLAINPKSYMKFAKSIWKTQGLSIIYLILAIVVFYYLIDSGLNIIQILAVTAFVSLLMGTQLAMYSKEIMALAQKMMGNKKEFWAKNWLYILIWTILLLMGLAALLS